jgi:hypothetical protein
MNDWLKVKEYKEITYDKFDQMARIAFDRPEKRNAFMLYCSLAMDHHQKMGNMHFAPEEIKMFGGTQGILIKVVLELV